MRPNTFLRIGHRGAMAYATENSRESINRAIDFKVNMIEIDVRYSKDNGPVVFHDEKIDRLTDGSGKVSEMTLKELNSFKLKNGEKILTLEELLTKYLEDILINLELKEDHISEEIVTVLSKFDTRRILFSSFYHSNLAKIKDYFKNIKTAALLVGSPLDPVHLAEETNADYLDLNYEFVDRSLAETLHAKGIGLIVWKINAPEIAKKFIEIGTDGIITDDPAIFNKLESINKQKGSK